MKAKQIGMFPEGEDLPLFSGTHQTARDDGGFTPAIMREPAPQLPLELTEFWGEPISAYTREQAIADGVLVDVTEWASADKGFIGGFTCPVALTAGVWALVEVPEKSRNP